MFHFEDKLRPHTADVIRTLQKKAGLRCVMLTGDRDASAQRVAAAVGISEVHSGLKPEDKLHKVTSMSRQKGKYLAKERIGQHSTDGHKLWILLGEHRDLQYLSFYVLQLSRSNKMRNTPCFSK